MPLTYENEQLGKQLIYSVRTKVHISLLMYEFEQEQKKMHSQEQSQKFT